jgi:diguanylate cyclase (GGDEF)-like protein/PAS domain S-box-containing protein
MFFRKYDVETRLVALSAPRFSSFLFGKWMVALLLAIAGVVVINSNSHLFGPPLVALLLTAAVAAVLVSLRPSEQRSHLPGISAEVERGIDVGPPGESLFHSSPTPGFLVDCESMRILAANQAAAELYGFGSDEVHPELLSDLLCQDAIDAGSIARFPANGLNQHRRADGNRFWAELESRRVEYRGHPVWLVAVADVTSRIKLVQDLEASERRARELVELSPGIVFTHDLDGRLQMVNPAFATALGHTAEALIGHSLDELMVSWQRDAFSRYLQEINENGTGSGAVHMVRSDGSECVWEFHNLLREDADGTRSVLCSAIDIGECSHKERQLPDSSHKDALTGCYNRHHLETFRLEVGTAARWAAVVVDIDHPNVCNDSHGEAAGDQALVRTARMLESMVRKGDSVVRLSDDEFVILLRQCDQATLESFAVRLQRARDGKASVPFTFGLAMRKDTEDLEQTIHRADRQMIERRQIERRSVCLDLPHNPSRRAALRSVVCIHPQVASSEHIPTFTASMEAEA